MKTLVAKVAGEIHLFTLHSCLAGLLAVLFFAPAGAGSTSERSPEFERRILEVIDLNQQEKYAESIKLLDEAGRDQTLNDYERATLWHNYGNIYLAREKMAEAQNAYERALAFKNQPDNFKSMTWQLLGAVYKSLKMEKQYIEAFRQAEALSSDPPPLVLAELGEIEYLAEKYPEAAAYFNRAITGAAKQGIPKEQWLVLYGTICMKLKQYDEFVDTMRQLAWFYRNDVAIKALQDYSKGMEPLLTEPDAGKRKKRQPPMRERVFLTLQLAQGEMDLNHYDGAKQTLNGLLKDASLNSYERPMVWRYLSFLYQLQEQYPLAIYASEQLLRHPDLTELLQNSTRDILASLYMLTGQYETSNEIANRLLKDDADLNLLSLICQNYFGLKDFKKMVIACERVIAEADKQSVPAKPLWLQALAIAYKETGDTKNYELIQRRRK